MVWVLNTGCDGLTLRSAWGPLAGHSQALSPGLVLLTLTALNKVGNLTAFSFLDISLQTSMCKSSEGIGETKESSQLPHPSVAVGGKPCGPHSCYESSRRGGGRPDQLPWGQLLSLRLVLMGVAPRKVSPVGGSWGGGRNWSLAWQGHCHGDPVVGPEPRVFPAECSLCCSDSFRRKSKSRAELEKLTSVENSVDFVSALKH